MADITEMITSNQNQRLGRLIVDQSNQAKREILKGVSHLSHSKKEVEEFVSETVKVWLRKNYPAPALDGYNNAIEFFSGAAKGYIIEAWEKVQANPGRS